MPPTSRCTEEVCLGTEPQVASVECQTDLCVPDGDETLYVEVSLPLGTALAAAKAVDRVTREAMKRKAHTSHRSGTVEGSGESHRRRTFADLTWARV